MTKLNEKIEASIMLASYFETVGFKNGVWEFNYRINTDSLSKYINILAILLHHYTILGGSLNIDITDWYASDDTIMILATSEAIINGGGENNYIKAYINYYDLLYDAKRASGINTIDTLKLLKKGIRIDNMVSKSNMGGNGAAMRTGPIGIFWHKNIEKVIQESIIASRLTHNYYIGFLGGMVTALFTSFAINNIPAWKWAEELIKLYNNKTIHKYWPKEQVHKIEDLDDYISYWKRYQETRISKLKYKNSIDNFIFPNDRAEFLMGFFPNQKIKTMALQGQSFKNLSWDWNRLGGSGLDVCIYTYDCLLMSIQPKNIGTKIMDLNDIKYCWDTFMTLVSVHPGDSDTTGAIGGTWFGALNGWDGFDNKRTTQLEFNNELKKVVDKFKAMI
jgi:ADP-ribosylarginine hydrolase